MEYEIFKSNSFEGDCLILDMMNYEKKLELSRNLFTSFTESLGYSAWHIHNGWVQNGCQTGDILHIPKLNISWLPSHKGYAGTSICPKVGDKMIIIKDSPDMEKLEPFILYCYEVMGRRNDITNTKVIYIQFLEIRTAVFNSKETAYEIYHKKQTTKKSFFKKIIEIFNGTGTRKNNHSSTIGTK